MFEEYAKVSLANEIADAGSADIGLVDVENVFRFQPVDELICSCGNVRLWRWGILRLDAACGVRSGLRVGTGHSKKRSLRSANSRLAWMASSRLHIHRVSTIHCSTLRGALR